MHRILLFCVALSLVAPALGQEAEPAEEQGVTVEEFLANLDFRQGSIELGGRAGDVGGAGDVSLPRA